jgi:hypothetical protein
VKIERWAGVDEAKDMVREAIERAKSGRLIASVPGFLKGAMWRPLSFWRGAPGVLIPRNPFVTGL